jgi:hypothetical protein
MRNTQQPKSTLETIFALLGCVIGFILSSLLTDNFLLSLIGGFIGYVLGKKVGRWISARTAALIAIGGGMALLSLRFLGFKVFEVIVEKIIEAFMF